jgi:serine protease
MGTGTVTGTVRVSAAAQPRAAAVPARPVRGTLNQPSLVPDRLMVKFRAGASASATADVHRQAGATVVRTVDKLDVQVVRLAPGTAAGAAMAAYRASGLVEYVEQDAYASRMATPTDPQYSSQWHYPQIDLPTAWNTTTGGAVIVAVIDSGIRADHPDLTGVTVTGFDFNSDPDNGDGDGRDSDPTDPGCPNIDPSDLSHGTHVSGTIAARTNNGVGVAGVNWGGVSPTRLMALRVLGQVQPFTNPVNCGVGSYSDIADAIIYAADHGAKVINMSLGGSAGSTTVDSAIAYARARSVTIAAAAGNGSCSPVSYPARNSNVIAVAATTNTNTRASYSNCGLELDVAAPGGSTGAGVLSTTWSPAGGHVYASFQGTSMATPHVSGLIALMISRGINDPTAIQSALQTTATDLGPAGHDNEFGFGLVNAAMAIGGGSAAGRLRAFAGTVSASNLAVESDVVVVTPAGAFTITNAQAGTRSVFAWQDFNGNGVIDTGDSYGRIDSVTIPAGGTTSGVAVTVQRYTGSSITPTGAPLRR